MRLEGNARHGVPSFDWRLSVLFCENFAGQSTLYK